MSDDNFQLSGDIKHFRDEVLSLGSHIDRVLKTLQSRSAIFSNKISEDEKADEDSLAQRLESFKENTAPGQVVNLVKYYEKKIVKLEAELHHRELIKEAIKELIEEKR